MIAAVAVAAIGLSLLGASRAAAATSPPVPETIHLSGVLNVVAVEPKAPAGGVAQPPADPAAPETIVTLVTADAQVQLTGAALAGAVSGTAFDGTVAVPTSVARAVQQDPRTPNGPPVGEIITEKAEAASATMEVVDAVLTPPTSSTGSATAHTLDVMFLAPAGHATPTADDVSGLTARMNEYWASQSNGQIASVIEPGALLLRTATSTEICNPDWTWTYASGAQGFNRSPAQGSDTTSYYWLGGHAAHLLVIVPEDVCGWQGLGSIGPMQGGGMMWASVPTAPIEWDAVAFHEFGHNLGLGHSDIRICPFGASDGSGCADQSYTDYYDVMAGGVAIGDFNNFRDVPALNVTHRARLNALPRGTDLRDVNATDGVSQAFTLSPISAEAGLRGLEITDPLNGEKLYVEYRSGTGRDAAAFYSDMSSAGDSPYPDWLRPGVRVLTFSGCSGADTCPLGSDSTVLQHRAPQTYGPYDDPGNPLAMYYLSGEEFSSGTILAGRHGVRVHVSSITAAQASVTVDFDASAPPPFLDVPWTYPFAQEIAWMAGQGISTGYPVPGGKEYRPLGTVGRDAMAAFLYRFANRPDFTPPPTSPFTDVPTSHPFYKEISWLASTGVTTGWDVGGGKKEFRPSLPIARDAMAAFLYRFANRPDFTPPPTSPFTDVPTSHPFYKEISWLAGVGVTTGWDVGGGRKEFRPALNIARDAMAAFLYRFHAYQD